MLFNVSIWAKAKHSIRRIKCVMRLIAQSVASAGQPAGWGGLGGGGRQRPQAKGAPVPSSSPRICHQRPSPWTGSHQTAGSQNPGLASFAPPDTTLYSIFGSPLGFGGGWVSSITSIFLPCLCPLLSCPSGHTCLLPLQSMCLSPGVSTSAGSLSGYFL